MSGNCATGMRNSDRTPASVIRTAMTIASRGRSTKTAEIMRLLSRRPGRGGRRRGGAGYHLYAGSDPLDAVPDHHFAFAETRHDDRRRWCGLAEPDTPLLHLVLAVDDVDVLALLVRQHRRTRDAQSHHWLNAFDQHCDEFAIDQLSVHWNTGLDRFASRVGNCAPQQDRVGGALH